jgi:hypothetical protein
MTECNDYIKLYANKESSIKSIQKEFNEHYPFLKIELYKIYYKGEPLPKALVLTFAESAKKLDFAYDGRIININKARTVADVEKDFEVLFGLSALVFRKSGNVWVETTLTDDWTLEEQNKEGEQISLHFQ